MKNYTNIVVVGSMSWDTIMDFPDYFVDFINPKKLHRLDLNFVLSNLEKQMGGTATNIAYGASQTAKVIKPKTSKSKIQLPILILGGLGKDGKEHRAFLKKNNIDTSGIVTDNVRFSASGNVITDLKNNQIWGFYYGACEAGKNVQFNKFVKKDSLMIVSSNHPLAFMAAQRFAIKNKTDYLYDAGMSLTWIKDRDLKQGVVGAKYVIGNDYEIAMITKRIKTTVEELVKKEINVITTLGDQGARLDFATDSAAAFLPASAPGSASCARVGEPLRPRHLLRKSVNIAACKVKKVADPTGAGDAWRGGFMVALSMGYDMIECLKIGNVMASFAIEKYGTVNYKISKKEFNRRLVYLKTQILKGKSIS